VQSLALLETYLCSSGSGSTSAQKASAVSILCVGAVQSLALPAVQLSTHLQQRQHFKTDIAVCQLYGSTVTKAICCDQRSKPLVFVFTLPCWSITTMVALKSDLTIHIFMLAWINARAPPVVLP